MLNQYHKRANRYIFYILLGTLLMGCGVADQGAITNTITPTEINVDNAVGTHVALEQAYKPTEIARSQEVAIIRATELAIPTWSPNQPPPPRTPAPTAESHMEWGFSYECDSRFYREFDTLGCWRTYQNNRLLVLYTLRSIQDTNKMYLHVVGSPDSNYPDPAIYLVPQSVGVVAITQVTIPYVFLQTSDHQHTFIFNLTTRAWETSTTIPLPTNTPRSCQSYVIDGNMTTFLEAEWFHKMSGSFRVVTDTTRSQGAFMTIPQNTSDTNTDIEFNITINNGGTFYIWLLGTGPNSSADSFSIQLDNNTEITAPVITSNWGWKKISSTITIPNGEHILRLTERERGAKVDKLLLVKSNDYTPTGLGNIAQGCAQ